MIRQMVPAIKRAVERFPFAAPDEVDHQRRRLPTRNDVETHRGPVVM
jgi:hypothetical protein